MLSALDTCAHILPYDADCTHMHHTCDKIFSLLIVQHSMGSKAVLQKHSREKAEVRVLPNGGITELTIINVTVYIRGNRAFVEKMFFPTNAGYPSVYVCYSLMLGCQVHPPSSPLPHSHSGVEG